MKLTLPQLSKQAESPLPAVIWLSGDEPLLVQEAADTVRAAARQQGIAERQIFDVDAKFDGSDLIAAGQSMSLFGDRELLELRVSGKFSDKGRKALVEAVTMSHGDNPILIISDRIEASQSKAKWFNQVVDKGWWVPIWPIEYAQLPRWISQRLQQQGLQADAEALALLVERIDGNLLAAQQEIAKLRLLSDDGRVTPELIVSCVADSARYTVFDLADALLLGDLVRSQKILNGLRGEGVEAPIVLWLVTKELRTLVALMDAQQQGQPLPAVFKKHRIFDKRQGPYRTALNRANAAHWQKTLVACSRIDGAIKGQSKDDPWVLLSEMVVAITAPNLPAYVLP